MVSFFPEVGLDGSREPASEFVIQDLGHAEAGWKPLLEVLNKICANSEELVFRAFFSPREEAKSHVDSTESLVIHYSWLT